MGLYLATPYARAALERDGHWEQAVRIAAGHHVHIRAAGREGPFFATAQHSLTEIEDPDPLRAIERAIERDDARQAAKAGRA